MRFWTLLIASLLFAAMPAKAAVKIAKQSFHKQAKLYEISVEYPKTGVKAVDDAISKFAKSQIAQYMAETPESAADAGAGGSYSFDLNYTVERNDNQVFAVTFAESTYTGGAHPNGFFYSFNFLMPDGAQVFLPEIVDGQRGIARISDYAIRDLNKQMAGPDSGTDNDWIKRGAGPLAPNFEVFVLKPTHIDIQFPSYQVASYASGPQEVKVPLNFLKGYMRKDWRAPQPSFDCTKARSGIEHAICGDAMLARMDRQTAEKYASNLANSYEKNDAVKWRQSQRDWQAARDKACNVAEPSGCLKKSYAARLAALQKVSP